MRGLGVLAMVLTTVSVAAASGLDGSVPMRCAIKTVMVCNDPATCVRGTAATVNFPPTLDVDVPGRRVSGAATGRTARITNVGRGGGRLLIQGEDLGIAGVAWNVVVAEDSGAMSGAVLSHGGGFLMFGSCTPGSGS